MRETIPEARIAYMDVNGRRRGHLWPHLSHGNGVDVDIELIGRTPEGKVFPTETTTFLVGYIFKYNRTRHSGTLTFDAEANWLLLEGLHRNHSKDIQLVFVEPYIRQWLLAEGKRRGATPEMIEWVESHVVYAGDNLPITRTTFTFGSNSKSLRRKCHPKPCKGTGDGSD